MSSILPRNILPGSLADDMGERSPLFDPITIRGVEIPNRIMMSPMCQYSAVDGFANDWHLVHLVTRAVGGCGIVMLETSAFEPDGRISGWDLGIWSDQHVDVLARIASLIREHGSVPAIQIGHAGRKASQRRPWEGGGPLPAGEGAWQTISASSISFDDGWPVPDEMTVDDIQRVVGSFEDAARRAREAGFQILEVHAAHGYLVNQFIASSSNRRADEYGGSFENRLRFAREVFQAIRREWPDDFPLFARISATDWSEGGWGIDDSLALVRVLHSLGVDVIDVSSGGNVAGVTVPTDAGYQVHFSETIRQETGVPTVTVGLITSAEHAHRIVDEGMADIVALGRELLRNPYWPLEAANRLRTHIEWPPQYLRAMIRDW
jgi:2,4-dienoyl-CoA reductase-like NADH-dependent reductase (Old Yellow Enzyme family)